MNIENRKLANLEPEAFFRYFEDLTRIPRPSGKEEKVVEYLMDFAKENGLYADKDEFNNVLIKKPASKGYEDHDTIILQAHIDMVCEKNPGVEHDFDKDSINITVEDGKVIAKETTLGADDGVGVAYAMAILADKNIKHPAIEFLATSDEERGMTGIENFDFSKLKGSKVINIDSDDEGLVVVGCAGGPVIRVKLPLSYKDADNKNTYKIKISGLAGGHSGEDIHRGRANSNKLMVRVMMEALNIKSLEVADIIGGDKYNAIPRNTEAYVNISLGDESRLKEIVAKYEKIFRHEYRVSDSGIYVQVEKTDTIEKVLDRESTMRVLDFINFVDTGIIRMDMDYPDTVETSISLGVIRFEGDKTRIEIMTRSSMESQFELLADKVFRLTELLGGDYEVMSNCPPWEYVVDSDLRTRYEEVWEEMTGEKPKMMILHAGLEPSEFAKHIDRELDMISVGPDIRLLHAPGEYFVIDSAKKVYESVIKLLERL